MLFRVSCLTLGTSGSRRLSRRADWLVCDRGRMGVSSNIAIFLLLVFSLPLPPSSLLPPSFPPSFLPRQDQGVIPQLDLLLLARLPLSSIVAPPFSPVCQGREQCVRVQGGGRAGRPQLQQWPQRISAPSAAATAPSHTADSAGPSHSHSAAAIADARGRCRSPSLIAPTGAMRPLAR